MDQQLKGGIFITPKEIQILTNHSFRRSQVEHQSIRDALGKKGKRLTVKEYCEYEQLDYQEVVAALNPYR